VQPLHECRLTARLMRETLQCALSSVSMEFLRITVVRLPTDGAARLVLRLANPSDQLLEVSIEDAQLAVRQPVEVRAGERREIVPAQEDGTDDGFCADLTFPTSDSGAKAAAAGDAGRLQRAARV